MAKKKTTIEDLAVMVKRGFDQTVTKEEFRKEIKEIKEQVTNLAADVSQLKEDINRDDPFVEDLLRRMRVVEKRTGVVK